MLWKPILTTVLLLPLSFSGAHAQEPTPEPGRIWGLIMTPYALLASNSTDVDGQKIRQSFGDLTDLTDAGFQMRTTAFYKRAHLTVDWTYARLQVDQELGVGTLGVTINQWIVDIGAGARFFDDREEGSPIGNSLYLRAGARYWENDIKGSVRIGSEGGLLPPVDLPFADKQNWWDPMITFVGSFGVTETVGFGLKAAGGGFGIGNASKFVYDFEGLAHFKLASWFMISTGYRQFYYTREDGEGEDLVSTKVLVTGPMIGGSFQVF